MMNAYLLPATHHAGPCRALPVLLVVSSIIAMILQGADAFLATPKNNQGGHCYYYHHQSSSLHSTRSSARADEERLDSNFLLEYRTVNGEFLNPYFILKVSDDADTSEIKNAYRTLSRTYHPDGFRHNNRKLQVQGILPGSCNSMDDVRDHWENIRLSYEILRNDKQRKRYDRNVVLADPGEAVKKAAVDATFNAAKGMVSGLGKGILNVGTMAFQHISKTMTEKAEEEKKKRRKMAQQQQQQQQQQEEVLQVGSSTSSSEESLQQQQQQQQQLDANNNLNKLELDSTGGNSTGAAAAAISYNI